jgi:hypothetical protein
MKQSQEISKLCEKLTVASFLLLLGIFSLLNWLLPSPDVSVSERRKLATLPEIRLSSLVSGTWSEDFETYAEDHFLLRDHFRSLKAVITFDLLRQTDLGGLYRSASGIGKFERINEASYRQAAAKIRSLTEDMTDLHVYYAVIPDKSLYSGFFLPGFDSVTAERILQEELPELTAVSLVSALSAKDFYSTDLHWRQESLIRPGGVLEAFQKSMSISLSDEFTPVLALPDSFSGVYSGQLALSVPPDSLYYLQSDRLRQVTAEYLDTTSAEFVFGPVYDREALSGDDPYGFFLRGAQPLIVLHSPDSETDRTLYLFRDSFSSPLAPLFTTYYRKIVLIDLRYIDSRLLPEYVSFETGSDVLFLYSSQVWNHASTLLVTIP